MASVFIIKNQHNEYLDRSNEWVDASQAKSFYKTAHKDEAINQKVEIAVKRPDLRLKTVEAQTNEKGVLSPEMIASESPKTEDSSHHSHPSQEIDLLALKRLLTTH